MCSRIFVHFNIGAMIRKSSLLVLAAAFMMAGCATTATLERRQAFHRITELSRSPYTSLKLQIDSTLSDTLFPPANIGIKIVSLLTGDTLYELNPDMLFTPGSNQKLFTSACALVDLGKEFQLTTTLYADSLNKRIFVKGSGDPLLSTNDLDSLARLVVENVLPDSAWTLVGDVSYFDSLYWGHGWMWDDEQDDYNMAVSPLSVNSNAITVQIWPGKLEDSPVHRQSRLQTTLPLRMTLRLLLTHLWHHSKSPEMFYGDPTSYLFPDRC